VALHAGLYSHTKRTEGKGKALLFFPQFLSVTTATSDIYNIQWNPEGGCYF